MLQKHCVKLPVPLSTTCTMILPAGGGNAAHVAAGMYSHRGAKVNMFLSDEKEVQQWQQHMQGGIEVHRRKEGDIYKGAVVNHQPISLLRLYTCMCMISLSCIAFECLAGVTVSHPPPPSLPPYLSLVPPDSHPPTRHAASGSVSAASADPAAVIPQADLILIIVPAFAHRPILT